MKRYITLTKEAWVFLAILIVVIVSAMIREINLLIILAGLLLGPFLVNWQVVRMTTRNLSCSRRLPHAVYPGELIEIALLVTNKRKRLDSWGVVVEDRWRTDSGNRMESGAKEFRARAFVPQIKAGATERTVYRGKLWQRGRYILGPIRLSTSVPVGLIRGTTVVPKSKGKILVFPRLGTISRQWKELVKVEQSGQRSSRRHQGRREGDFYGLREWRNGDSRRWIHWRSSAKRNELTVRQFEQTKNQNFVIALDLRSDNQEAIEKAISFVATVIVDHCRRNGGNLILGVAGREIEYVKGSASNALVQEALEILAEAQATSNDRLPEVIDNGLGAVTMDDRVVVVSAERVDLQDTNRFQAIWNDVQKRRALARTINVNVCDAEFDRWFTFNENKSDVEKIPELTVTNG